MQWSFSQAQQMKKISALTVTMTLICPRATKLTVTATRSVATDVDVAPPLESILAVHLADLQRLMTRQHLGTTSQV